MSRRGIGYSTYTIDDRHIFAFRQYLIIKSLHVWVDKCMSEWPERCIDDRMMADSCPCP